LLCFLSNEINLNNGAYNTSYYTAVENTFKISTAEKSNANSLHLLIGRTYIDTISN